MTLSGDTYDVQGVPIADLCRDFGTPLYIYDAETIVGQVKKLNAAFSGCDLKIVCLQSVDQYLDFETFCGNRAWAST